MAILAAEPTKVQNRILVKGLPPKGGYVATCIDIEDEMNVQRRLFDDPNTMETVNLISFYFGFRIKTGEMFAIRTKRMKISLHENSALYAFLAGWLGEAPKAGFDTDTLKGAGAQISIIHSAEARSGKLYANIATISPVMEDLKPRILAVTLFDGVLAPKAGATAVAAPDNEHDDIPF